MRLGITQVVLAMGAVQINTFNKLSQRDSSGVGFSSGRYTTEKTNTSTPALMQGVRALE